MKSPSKSEKCWSFKFREDFSQSEVSQLYLIITNHDIFGFDIPMKDSFFLEIGTSWNQFLWQSDHLGIVNDYFIPLNNLFESSISYKKRYPPLHRSIKKYIVFLVSSQPTNLTTLGWSNIFQLFCSSWILFITWPTLTSSSSICFLTIILQAKGTFGLVLSLQANVCAKVPLPNSSCK